MKKVFLVLVGAFVLGCGGGEESSEHRSDRIKKAVEDAVTKDFKIYERAKDSVKKIEEDNKKMEQQLK